MARRISQDGGSVVERGMAGLTHGEAEQSDLGRWYLPVMVDQLAVVPVGETPFQINLRQLRSLGWAAAGSERRCDGGVHESVNEARLHDWRRTMAGCREHVEDAQSQEYHEIGSNPLETVEPDGLHVSGPGGDIWPAGRDKDNVVPQIPLFCKVGS
jgi:hypothetical protein